MDNFNKIFLEGNLVRDPEMKLTPKGIPLCKFSVASNRAYKMDDEYQKEVSFFDITTWSRLAEVCGEFLKKGRGVRVEGRLKQDRWQDPDGKNRSKVHVVASRVEFKPEFKGKKDEEIEEGKLQEAQPVAAF